MTIDEISETNHYLTFKLDEEFFTVNVCNVREILEYVKITKMPDSPEFMKGIINVRGGIVPVIDLRLKFGMEPIDLKATTRIVVLEIEKEGGVLVIGMLADSVKEVIELRPEQIDPPPDIGGRWKQEFLKGIAKYNDEFVILLDTSKIFSCDELTSIAVEETDIET